jgi:hypothetical protein
MHATLLEALETLLDPTDISNKYKKRTIAKARLLSEINNALVAIYGAQSCLSAAAFEATWVMNVSRDSGAAGWDSPAKSGAAPATPAAPPTPAAPTKAAPESPSSPSGGSTQLHLATALALATTLSKHAYNFHIRRRTTIAVKDTAAIANAITLKRPREVAPTIGACCFAVTKSLFPSHAQLYFADFMHVVERVAWATRITRLRLNTTSTLTHIEDYCAFFFAGDCAPDVRAAFVEGIKERHFSKVMRLVTVAASSPRRGVATGLVAAPAPGAKPKPPVDEALLECLILGPVYHRSRRELTLTGPCETFRSDVETTQLQSWVAVVKLFPAIFGECDPWSVACFIGAEDTPFCLPSQFEKVLERLQRAFTVFMAAPANPHRHLDVPRATLSVELAAAVDLRLSVTDLFAISAVPSVVDAVPAVYRGVTIGELLSWRGAVVKEQERIAALKLAARGGTLTLMGLCGRVGEATGGRQAEQQAFVVLLLGERAEWDAAVDMDDYLRVMQAVSDPLPRMATCMSSMTAAILKKLGTARRPLTLVDALGALEGMLGAPLGGSHTDVTLGAAAMSLHVLDNGDGAPLEEGGDVQAWEHSVSSALGIAALLAARVAPLPTSPVRFMWHIAALRPLLGPLLSGIDDVDVSDALWHSVCKDLIPAVVRGAATARSQPRDGWEHNGLLSFLDVVVVVEAVASLQRQYILFTNVADAASQGTFSGAASVTFSGDMLSGAFADSGEWNDASVRSFIAAVSMQHVSVASETDGSFFASERRSARTCFFDQMKRVGQSSALSHEAFFVAMASSETRKRLGRIEASVRAVRPFRPVSLSLPTTPKQPGALEVPVATARHMLVTAGGLAGSHPNVLAPQSTLARLLAVEFTAGGLVRVSESAVMKWLVTIDEFVHKALLFRRAVSANGGQVGAIVSVCAAAWSNNFSTPAEAVACYEEVLQQLGVPVFDGCFGNVQAPRTVDELMHVGDVIGNIAACRAAGNGTAYMEAIRGYVMAGAVDEKQIVGGLDAVGAMTAQLSHAVPSLSDAPADQVAGALTVVSHAAYWVPEAAHTTFDDEAFAPQRDAITTMERLFRDVDTREFDADSHATSWCGVVALEDALTVVAQFAGPGTLLAYEDVAPLFAVAEAELAVTVHLPQGVSVCGPRKHTCDLTSHRVPEEVSLLLLRRVCVLLAGLRDVLKNPTVIGLVIHLLQADGVADSDSSAGSDDSSVVVGDDDDDDEHRGDDAKHGDDKGPKVTMIGSVDELDFLTSPGPEPEPEHDAGAVRDDRVRHSVRAFVDHFFHDFSDHAGSRVPAETAVRCFSTFAYLRHLGRATNCAGADWQCGLPQLWFADPSYAAGTDATFLSCSLSQALRRGGGAGGLSSSGFDTMSGVDDSMAELQDAATLAVGGAALCRALRWDFASVLDAAVAFFDSIAVPLSVAGTQSEQSIGRSQSLRQTPSMRPTPTLSGRAPSSKMSRASSTIG